MGRIILMIVISLCMGLPIFGQKKASASEQASMVRTVEKAASSLKTMQCKFRQTKKLSLLNDKMVSTGVMYYSQPAKLRWQYQTPYNYTFVINGTKVMMKTDGRKNVIDARQSKMFKEITQIMVNSVTGKCLSNKKEFKTTMYKSNKEWTAHLVPMTKELKSMFKTIVLHISPKQSLVTQVDLIEKTGDVTNIVLSNYKTNVPINAKVFTVN